MWKKIAIDLFIMTFAFNTRNSAPPQWLCSHVEEADVAPKKIFALQSMSPGLSKSLLDYSRMTGAVGQ